jgi:hypothetical protein
MGVVCQACGAENRGGVKQCRLCAAALPAAPGSERERSRSRGRARQATAARANRRWLVAGLGALAVLLFWALLVPQRDGNPAVAAVQPVATTDRAPPVADTAGVASDNLAHATAAAEARLKASLERLEREDRARAEAQARERAAADRASQRQAEQTRRREQLATPRPEPAPVAQTASAAPQAAVPAQPASPDSRAAPALGVPAAAPTVEQRCADSGNFFSRSVCQSQACADPALSQDPACRRLRESERASRQDPAMLN